MEAPNSVMVTFHKTSRLELGVGDLYVTGGLSGMQDYAHF